MGGQQPRESADAVRQRSGLRSDRRGHLSARRRHRCRVGRNAGAVAAAAGGRWVVRHARRRDALPACRRQACEQELAVFVAAGRSGQARAPDAHATRRRRSAASACSATSSGASVRRAPASAASSSPSIDEASGAVLASNAYNTEFRDRVAFCTRPSARTSLHVRSGGVHRAQSHAEPARRAASANAWRPERRRARSVRGAADRVCRSAGRSRGGWRSSSARARTRAHARELAARYSSLGAVDDDARATRSARGTTTLGAVQVRTPDDSFDLHGEPLAAVPDA